MPHFPALAYLDSVVQLSLPHSSPDKAGPNTVPEPPSSLKSVINSINSN